MFFSGERCFKHPSHFVTQNIKKTHIPRNMNFIKLPCFPAPAMPPLGEIGSLASVRRRGTRSAGVAWRCVFLCAELPRAVPRLSGQPVRAQPDTQRRRRRASHKGVQWSADTPGERPARCADASACETGARSALERVPRSARWQLKLEFEGPLRCWEPETLRFTLLTRRPREVDRPLRDHRRLPSRWNAITHLDCASVAFSL